jgi:flagellar hook assembly protein FlgD
MATKLMNAFPNPFNPNTNIRYSLKEAGKVNISIYNVKGQLVRSYRNEHANPGYYQVSWDGKDHNGQAVSSGIYMYRMSSGKYQDAKKMILAK